MYEIDLRNGVSLLGAYLALKSLLFRLIDATYLLPSSRLKKPFPIPYPAHLYARVFFRSTCVEI